MKKQLFSFLLLLSFVFSVAAQKAQVAKPDEAQANLREHVYYLASEKLAGRRTGEPGATAAAGYIANMFARYKLKPGARAANGKTSYLQPFPYKDPEKNNNAGTGYNVIGILEGTDNQLKSEAIIVGAHYDHLGLGGKTSLAPNSSDIHHGADDNASGTSALIELARQYSKAKTNKRTIIFIAFSGEEEGLFGSKFYLNSPTFSVEKTVAMINMDMVGRLREDKLMIGGIGTASEWNELVKQRNELMIDGAAGNTVGRHFELQLDENGFGPSDHSSFYTKKIPVLFFFTGSHLDYHKPSDTADKINYEGLNKIALYVSGVISAIDNNPVKPTYAVAKSSATPGRTSFNVSLGTIPSYIDEGDGLIIDGVRDDSPAAKSGLTGGDKIIKLAGKEVKNITDYMSAMGVMKAGDEYEVVIKRGADTITLKIIPAPAAPRN